MATIDITAGVFAPREAGGDLEVAVTHAHGHTEIIADGELDPSAAWRLRERLALLIDSGEQRIVLDVDGLRLVDFASIGVVMEALIRAARNGAQVVIWPPECLLAKMLRHSGVPVRREFDPE